MEIDNTVRKINRGNDRNDSEFGAILKVAEVGII